MYERTQHLPIELAPGLLSVSEASITSPPWISIMEWPAAVCSQLLSRERLQDGDEAEPGLALQNQSSRLRWKPLVVKNDIEERTMHMQSAIPAQPTFVINEPQLAEFIHEETDAGPRGANHVR